MRRQLPLTLCFIAGVFMAVQYFIPHWRVQDTYDRFLIWLQIIFAFAFLLGTVSLVKVHFHKIRNRAADSGVVRPCLAATATGSSLSPYGLAPETSARARLLRPTSVVLLIQ